MQAAAPTRLEGPTAPPGAPRSGGRLVVGTSREPDSLHPWLARTAAAFDILDGVMDGLLRYTAAGKLQPALAEKFAISDDGLTYTFNAAPGRPLPQWRAVLGRRFRRRLGAFPATRDFDALSTLGWQKVASAELPTCDRSWSRPPSRTPPSSRRSPPTYLCPRQRWPRASTRSARSSPRAPVGTGPFRVTALASRAPRSSWAAGTVTGGSRRTWSGIALPHPARRRCAAGRVGAVEIDIAGGAGAIPPARVDEALALPGVTIFQHGTMNWQHVDLKQMTFLRETPVRQALDFATPRESIIADVLHGRAIPAFADQSPESWAYAKDLQPRPFNPAASVQSPGRGGAAAGEDGVRAREGKRFEIDLWGVAGDDQARAIVEAIAAEWNAIGVSTLPQFAPAEQLWGPLGYQFSDRMTGCLYTWTNANDPDDLFYWHFFADPLQPGRLRRQPAGVFLSIQLPGRDRPAHRRRGLDARFRRSGKRSMRQDPGALGCGKFPSSFSTGRRPSPRRAECGRILAERLDATPLECRRVVSRRPRSGDPCAVRWWMAEFSRHACERRRHRMVRMTADRPRSDRHFMETRRRAVTEAWQAGDIVANGIRLHYTRTGGAKPPLVLAHGVTDDGLCWSRLAEALAPSFDVVMVDARGHGRSQAPHR